MQHPASLHAAGKLTGRDADSLAVADAQRIILSHIEPIQATETVALKQNIDEN